MSAYQEPVEELQPQDRDIHRALQTLIEEVEAVDRYHQRMVTSSEPGLKEVMAHNKIEEIEHACMAIEWHRRNDPGWEKELREYLFTSAPITEIEEAATGAEGSGEPASATGRDIAIGSLKK